MQTKDFKGQDLRGRSFKNQDLTGADFSDCDLRGVDFSFANLTDAKFCNARMGKTLKDYSDWQSFQYLCGIVLGICASVIAFFYIQTIKKLLEMPHYGDDIISVTSIVIFSFIISGVVTVLITHNRFIKNLIGFIATLVIVYIGIDIANNNLSYSFGIKFLSVGGLAFLLIISIVAFLVLSLTSILIISITGGGFTVIFISIVSLDIIRNLLHFKME